MKSYVIRCNDFVTDSNFLGRRETISCTRSNVQSSQDVRTLVTETVTTVSRTFYCKCSMTSFPECSKRTCQRSTVTSIAFRESLLDTKLNITLFSINEDSKLCLRV